MHFSPCNLLMKEIKAYAAKMYDLPEWAFFPRWFTKGHAMWLESSSGSHLLTVNFDEEVVHFPSWTTDQYGIYNEVPMPAEWKDLQLGSLFNHDGSATYPDKYKLATDNDPYRKEAQSVGT